MNQNEPFCPLKTGPLFAAPQPQRGCANADNKNKKNYTEVSRIYNRSAEGTHVGGFPGQPPDPGRLLRRLGEANAVEQNVSAKAKPNTSAWKLYTRFSQWQPAMQTSSPGHAAMHRMQLK